MEDRESYMRRPTTNQRHGNNSHHYFSTRGLVQLHPPRPIYTHVPWDIQFEYQQHRFGRPRGSNSFRSRSHGHRGSSTWNRRSRGVSNVSSRMVSPPSSMAGSNIPGFIFDPERQRYFRAPAQGCSAANISFLPQELRRLVVNNNSNSNNAEGSSSESGKSVLPPSLKNKLPSNLTSLLRHNQLGSVPSDRLCNVSLEQRTREASSQNRYCIKLLEEPGNASLDTCQFLEGSADGKTMLGSWSIKERSWTRIMCLDVKWKGTPWSETKYGLQVQETGNYIYVMDRNIVDLCKASVDSAVTCVLYVTIPSGVEGSRIFFQPVPELSNVEDSDYLMSPIYNMHWGLQEAAFSCAWNSNTMRVGLGLERYEMVMDVVTEADFRLSSLSRAVLSQKFSKDGNLLFLGLRSADIICCDLRKPNHHAVFSLPQECTCWLQVLNSDPNYLVASNYYGEVKLWDLRQRRMVREFAGVVNSHTKTQLVMDAMEKLLFVVGEDGVTSGWSLKSAERLCTLEPPYPIESRSDIPRLAFSHCWGGGADNAALVMGVKDELWVHELRL